MSFTGTVKNEMTTLKITETAKIALISGFFRNNYQIIKDSITISSENESVIAYLKELLGSYEEISYSEELLDNNNFSKNKLKALVITKGDSFIKETFCIDNEVVPSYLVELDDEVRGYLKGVFLSSGSINDPKTSRYHLEFLIEKSEEAVFVQKLLNTYALNAKLLSRDKGFMLYIKEADKISDFLKIIGASKAVLYYEEIRVYRDAKNKTNRLNNCEQANMDRVIDSAMEQLNYIKILEDNMAIELLDDKTREALEYRKKYQEASLKELSEIISLETGKRITKSGLNHRFRKIKELALKFLDSK
ncbi:MAG TPA: DNA-binding protein WhiA [Candidatus Onthousia faecipullorum]|uniref:Probable cell division protein WhiA n=1 Tax=Candidatus Onthousia faecipullorum TaxID=2840887 RepID=A0A9D1GC06_9FIRM|nr:DNA-binding protein WhiA [Candidatus Onthousia faecipullorum]